MKEASIQRVCVKWFRLHYPRSLIAAIPNGGSRNVIEAVNLKAQGVLAGIPDLVILGPRGFTLWVEVKTETGKLTKNQRNMYEWMHDNGHKIKIIRSFEDFMSEMEKYQLNLQ